MTAEHTLRSLLAQKECEWIEFKRNDAKPDDVGRYTCACENDSAPFGLHEALVVRAFDAPVRARCP